MKWSEWKGTYESIVADFSFNMNDEVKAIDAAEETSRKMCSLKGKEAIDTLAELIREEVVIAGNSRHLEREAKSLVSEGILKGRTLIAADSAAPRLNEIGIRSDVIVSDMDGDVKAEMDLNEEGSLLLLHFHGDNYIGASEIAGKLKGKFMVTVQGKPTECTFNFGGFTDGDRAVMLAEEFRSGRIYLIGFDFEHPLEKGKEAVIKKKKLRWAKEIIEGVQKRGVMIKYADGGKR